MIERAYGDLECAPYQPTEIELQYDFDVTEL